MHMCPELADDMPLADDTKHGMVEEFAAVVTLATDAVNASFLHCPAAISPLPYRSQSEYRVSLGLLVVKRHTCDELPAHSVRHTKGFGKGGHSIRFEMAGTCCYSRRWVGLVPVKRIRTRYVGLLTASCYQA